MAATGATVGTAAYYLIGKGMERILPEKIRGEVEKGKKYLERYGALAIFFFAITPLPDQIMWIPVGIVKYDPKKAIVACWLGKLVLMATIVYASHFGLREILKWFT
ncbi:VTT domain-containing protein [Candidatus Bathyarchaeota archaeon]|nr:VTT domain-containing protein [Candidatus Bathyarchaeota archaeon]